MTNAIALTTTRNRYNDGADATFSIKTGRITRTAKIVIMDNGETFAHLKAAILSKTPLDTVPAPEVDNGGTITVDGRTFTVETLPYGVADLRLTEIA